MPSLAKPTIEVDIFLFTDGACCGNPGPGGWACILHQKSTGLTKEFSGGEKQTTNNQMEMLAVIEGLEKLKKIPTRVHVLSDSQYVIKGATEWMENWKRHGWKRKTKHGWQPVKNEDLWKTIDELMQKHHITFEYIPGHSGHPENERCDKLAVAAYQKYK